MKEHVGYKTFHNLFTIFTSKDKNWKRHNSKMYRTNYLSNNAHIKLIAVTDKNRNLKIV